MFDKGKAIANEFPNLENVHDKINALIYNTYEKKTSWK